MPLIKCLKCKSVKHIEDEEYVKHKTKEGLYKKIICETCGNREFEICVG